MKSKDFHVKPSKCPECGKILDAAMSVKGEGPPRTGDATVCIYCSAALQYIADGELKKILDDDLAAMALEAPRQFSLLVKAQNLVGLMRRGDTKSGCKDWFVLRQR